MRNIDRLYKIAENQAGYFTAQQARGVGYSWERLSQNVKNDTFLRVLQGVYRLSRFPHNPHEDMYIAWLKVGPASVISHESALAVYDLADVLPSQTHIIMPRSASRRRKGIRLHTSALRKNEISYRNGLPITSVERTITDVIRAGMPEDQVRDVVRDAFQRGLSSPEKMLTYSVGRKGKVNRVLQQIIEDLPDEVR
jgi:predicted transcriptional regulator of viral defense system